MMAIKDMNIKHKTVLVRSDLDISDGGDLRLEAGIPTIKYLLENCCKVIIIGHSGRPNGRLSDSLSLFPVFEKIRAYFPEKSDDDFKFISSVLSRETKEIIGQSKFEDIIMLENLRFYPGEEASDSEFSEYLASLADVFVNDAFAVCHREHSSIAGIPKFLPSCAGLRMEKEIEVLSKAMKNPKHPAVAIMGGAKIETKIPAISEMAKVFDYVLIGGRLGLEVSPLETGISWAENLKFQDQKPANAIFPADYIGEGKFDIGEDTIKQYKEIIAGAKTIVWNGPMGKFEDPEFIRGTKSIAEAIIESKAYSIIGGGDTIAAISKLGILFENFGWISTGGGAMLEFMAGKKLAGIEALN